MNLISIYNIFNNFSGIFTYKSKTIFYDSIYVVVNQATNEGCYVFQSNICEKILFH